jgi:hypothetical protein
MISYQGNKGGLSAVSASQSYQESVAYLESISLPAGVSMTGKFGTERLIVGVA